MSDRSELFNKLTDKEYRDAFIGSQIDIGLPFQIRALRDQRGWNQTELAKRAGMLQPRISAIERPGGAKLNLETLRRLASAFDVALIVRFAPFSKLVDWAEGFNAELFEVASFDDDVHKSALEYVIAIAPSKKTATGCGYLGLIKTSHKITEGDTISESTVDGPIIATPPQRDTVAA